MSGYTQQQLDTLRAAAASGVTRVMVDGKRVDYGTISELLRMISVMEQSLIPSTNRVTYHNPKFSKGV